MVVAPSDSENTEERRRSGRKPTGSRVLPPLLEPRDGEPAEAAGESGESWNNLGKLRLFFY